LALTLTSDDHKSLGMRVERPTLLLRHQVSEKLREAIFNMRFPPGTRLIERELCELTGVSRTLIREALRELEGEGLVQLLPKGPAVSVLTAEDARGIYDVRAALEGLAGRCCAQNATPATIAALRAALRDVEATYLDATSSGSEKLAAKSRFYDAIFAGAGNPVLTDVVRKLHGRINLLRAAYSDPQRTQRSLIEIRKIVAAIEKHDGDVAYERCVEHVKRAEEAALMQMDPPRTRGGAQRRSSQA